MSTSRELIATASALSASPSGTNNANTTEVMPANDLDIIQDMIDISADRLEGLRTQCATSATLTQQEIRSLEAKLVRMFSELLLTKSRLSERIPASGLPHKTGSELKQWLRVVGLSQESLNVCLTRLSTLEQLLEQSDEELKQMLCNNPSYREEEVRRLTKAMQNLRKCKDFLGNPCSSGGSEVSGKSKELLTEHLFWDSWDRHHHHHHRGSMGNIGVTASPRTHRMIVKQAAARQQQANSSRQSPSNDHSLRSAVSAINTSDDFSLSMQGGAMLTPTPSPPNSPYTPTSTSNFSSIVGGGAGGSLNGTPQRGKFAGTPPPMKKHQTLLGGISGSGTPTHHAVASAFAAQQQEHNSAVDAAMPLAKSKSNESQLYEQKLITAANSPPSLVGAGGSNSSTISRSRLHTDPSPDSYSSNSSDIVLENNNNANNSLQVPRSPCTPIVTLGMGHTISHRFTKVFKMVSTCDLCQKQLVVVGLKCKECKYLCHKDCEPNVPPSCGLPREFVDEFKKTLKDQVGFPSMSHAPVNVNTSPNLSTLSSKIRAGGMVRRNKSGSTINTQPDSSSPGSSCNSSSPSSPALFNLHQHAAATHATTGYMASVGGNNVMSSSGGGSSSTSSNMLSTPSSFHKNASQFNFPDVTITSNCSQPVGNTQTLISSQSGIPSDAGPAGSGELLADYQHETASLCSSKSVSGAGTHDVGAAIATSTAGGAIMHASITISSSNCNSVSMASSSSAASTTHSVISSIVSTGTGTFYPRKLSSAGVDKRAPFSELSDTHKSNDSDKTVSLSGSTSASTDSDRTPVRLDSTEDGDSGIWPRQNSLSLKEWDIPYNDLLILEPIGKGRFGTVHRALWHGDVAVKLLKEDYLGDEHMLEAFKLEVANFKKTRHENLVLFMGACMNPPYLAIVTSLCKGNTLYTYIHARRDKFTINKTTLVAQQISQGMGYLHARGIIHKDLRTKNIFLENGKVIITDFGLFSSTKLLYCDIGLGVPTGWLCYLAPELMRALLPVKPSEEILPFSKASDVYSFGTVWYELLCGEFPFKPQPPEAIIWQVGRGMKQTLANLQTSRDVKDILMLCWSFQADDRPDFAKLLTLLERLPKKRLARSPSHPVQLSRSAESVF